MTRRKGTKVTAAVQEHTTRRGRKPKGEAPELPPLDVDSLSIEPAPVPTRKNRASANNPFVNHVRDSYEYEEGRAVVVDAVQKGRVESLIRRAADSLGIGVSIQVDEVDGNRVKVSFAGKPRRVRKSKDESEPEPQNDAAGEWSKDAAGE